MACIVTIIFYFNLDCDHWNWKLPPSESYPEEGDCTFYTTTISVEENAEFLGGESNCQNECLCSCDNPVSQKMIFQIAGTNTDYQLVMLLGTRNPKTRRVNPTF